MCVCSFSARSHSETARRFRHQTRSTLSFRRTDQHRFKENLHDLEIAPHHSPIQCCRAGLKSQILHQSTLDARSLLLECHLSQTCTLHICCLNTDRISPLSLYLSFWIWCSWDFFVNFWVALSNLGTTRERECKPKFFNRLAFCILFLCERTY